MQDFFPACAIGICIIFQLAERGKHLTEATETLEQVVGHSATVLNSWEDRKECHSIRKHLPPYKKRSILTV